MLPQKLSLPQKVPLQVKQIDGFTYELSTGNKTTRVVKGPVRETIRWENYVIEQDENGFDIYRYMPWKHIGSYDFVETKVSYISGAKNVNRDIHFSNINLRVPITNRRVPIQVNQYMQPVNEQMMYYDSVGVPQQTVGTYVGLSYEDGPDVNGFECDDYERVLLQAQGAQRDVYYDFDPE